MPEEETICAIAPLPYLVSRRCWAILPTSISINLAASRTLTVCRTGGYAQGLAMVDIHCHILPALDDGATEDAVSRQMFEMAARDGIVQIVATPHANYQYKFDAQVNRNKRDQLQASMGATPEILLGCDFHLSFENIEDAKRDHTRYSINGKQYLLVEFADSNIPPHTDQIFFDLISCGIVPIITHPERNPILADQPELIATWIGLGCAVQVTAGSVTGKFGTRALRSTQTMLKYNMVHFIATDAHNLTTRPPVLSEARETIARDISPEVAELLSNSNPRAVVEGLPMPWLPQPVPMGKRGWFSFLR